MKILPTGMQAHLDSGATTLCHCWKLTCANGEVSGFTSHDRDLVFDGVIFVAQSGFEASAIESSLGLNVDDLEVIGALQAATLNEAGLASGKFDNAEIEIYRVNWKDVSQRVITASGNLGEVRRGRVEFRAELRGLAHHLNQPTGRLYQYGCDVDLGSAKCGVNLDLPAYRSAGTVSGLPFPADSARVFTASGLDAFDNEWFSRGKVLWTSGANEGLAMEVKLHGNAAGVVTIDLWQEMPHALGVGDAFVITAGCAKLADICRSKFNNLVNYRGFHMMPGNDWVQSYPRQGGGNDGGSRL